MKLELDHIVHFVNNPEEAAASFHQLGLKAVQGGRHEMWGTYNALSYFGLSYIELIGVFDEELLEKSASQLYTLHATYKKQNYREGFIRVALRTDDIQALADQYRDAGYEVYGPDAFQRVKPDGSIVSWSLLHVGKADQYIDLPFFIQWDEADEQRLQLLQQQQAVNDGWIDKVTITAAEPLRAAQEWASILDGRIVKRDDGTVSLKIGNTLFVFEKAINSEPCLSQVTITMKDGSNGIFEVFNGVYEIRSMN